MFLSLSLSKTHSAVVNGNDTVSLPCRIVIVGHLHWVGRRWQPFLLGLLVYLEDVGCYGEHRPLPSGAEIGSVPGNGGYYCNISPHLPRQQQNLVLKLNTYYSEKNTLILL